jgi:outer membrane receptor protein involved in Fe transport
MVNIRTFFTVAAALCLLLSVAAQATESWDFSARARAGFEQNSNVNISELEQASGQGDVASLLEADITVAWQTTAKLRLESGYSVQDKNYREANDFNTRLQLAYLDAGYQLSAATLGANVYYAQADLDQAQFLTLYQASLYSMHNLSDSIFLRPAVTFANKSFARFTQRDAITAGASLDTFWFFTSGSRFISLGLLYENENSRDRAFSYQAPGLRLKLSGRYSLWQLNHTLQLGAKLSQRRYQSVTGNNNDILRRQDTQHQLEASWQLDVNPHLALLTKLEHGDFSSTLDSADYRETRSSLTLQLGF